jgi:site-specific DNA-methyltransferase (adenine-specific)
MSEEIHPLIGSVADVLSSTARAHIAHADALDFLRSLPPASCDILVTDPPYSSGGLTRTDRARGGTVKYSQAASANGPLAERTAPEIEGDTRDQRSWSFWVALWLSLSRPAMKPGAIAAVFCDWRQIGALQDAMQAGGFTLRGFFPWIKPGARPCLGRFTNATEVVVWGTNGKRALEGATHPGHFEGRTPKNERRAVCSKPVALMEALLGPCPAGGVVLDPFVGWGATPVAALRTDRRFLGCEISEANRGTALERVMGPEVPWPPKSEA